MKFFGKIGYVGTQIEVRPGIFQDQVIERKAYGEEVRNTGNIREGEFVNDDVSVTKTISVVMDAFARDNYLAIRYVNESGVFWKVTSVDVESPRLVLRLGGVWNGQKA